MKYNFKKFIILSGCLIFAVVLNLIYFFALPAVINIEKYKPEIRQYLKENVSVPLELGKLDIDMMWNLGIRIKAEKASLKKHDGSKFINIGNSYIEVALLPLINNNVIIRKAEINNPDINLTRFKDGTFDVSKIFIKKGKHKYKVEFNNALISLNNYKIDFTDKYIAPEKEIVFDGENIEILEFTPEKHIGVKVSGKASEATKEDVNFDLFANADFPLNKKHPTESRLRLGGKIKNFDLNSVKPYINKYSPRNFTVFSGNGSVNFDIDLNKDIQGKRKFFIDSETKGLNVIDSVKGNVLSHAGTLAFVTRGNFDDNDLYLDEFRADGDKINTNITGLISNFARKKIRNVDLNIDINNSRAKTVAEVFPKIVKVPLDPFNKILKHNIDGNLTGNLKARGYYRKPDLFGKVTYDDFSIIEKVPGTKNGYGTVDFFGPTLVLNSIQYMGKDEFVKTTGSITPFKGKTLKLSINSTQNVDFAKAQPVLLVIRDMFQFKLKPVTEMDIKGTGKTNLDLEGPFKDLKITGYVEAKNATVKYETLAGKAENVNGKIQFTGDKVCYDELNGYVEGLKVIPSGYTTLDGYTDMKLYIQKLDLKKAQKFVYDSPLLEKAQVALKDIIDIKGFADSTITIKGTEEKAGSSGIFKFNDVYLSYKGYGEPFNNLKGQLRYDNEDVYFDDINGNALENNVTVKGSVNGLNKNIDLAILSDNIRLEDAKKFVMSSSLLVKTQDIIKEFTFVKGTASINLILKGKADADCLKSLILSNLDASFEHSMAGFPVKVSQGSLNITDDTIQTQGIKGSAANSDFVLKGKVSNLKANYKKNAPLIPDMEIKIKRFSPQLLKEIAKAPLVPVKTKKILSEISNPEGYADVLVNLKPSMFNVLADFDGFAMYLKKDDIYMVIDSGKAEITDKNLIFSNLKGKISNSDFYINGSIKNYVRKPVFEIASSLEFNPDDADKLSTVIKRPVALKSSIPVAVNLKGKIDNWNMHVKMALNKGTSLNYANQMGLPDDKTRILSIHAKGKKDKIDIDSLNISTCDSDNNYTCKKLWELEVSGENENLLHCSGSIDKLKTLKPVFRNFKIYTNKEKPLSVCILNTGIQTFINNGNEKFLSEGNFKADLTLNGYIFKPDISGSVTFSDLKIPDYKLALNNANIIFSKDLVDLDLKGLKIDDSTADISAVIDYPLESPLMVRNMKITSDFMNLDNIARVFVANQKAVENTSEELKTPGFIIQNGTLKAKEIILHDLITSDAKANINFTPDWLLSVSDIQVNAAGGMGTGNIYYNAKSTELSFNMIAKNMQANALATTLFRFPNEVYGTLNGEGHFYTRGRNLEEIISNSNGYASFKIYDGRLVRLGSLEYLLRAANVLQSGIGGLNFNNIIDLVIPQKTGYFESLEGKFDVKDGVLSTEEISSSGENLSLYISGNFDMLTNYTEAKVYGKLSKKVSGLLGPLGSFSINQFIGYIPGFGFLPTAPGEKGLVDLIPGLSKIPVLGLGCFQKNRQFVVDINGNLYEQSSVKSFRWLD